MENIKFESNKDRLAHIGLQAVSNFHDIYGDIRRLYFLGEQLKNDEIIKIAENIKFNLISVENNTILKGANFILNFNKTLPND